MAEQDDELIKELAGVVERPNLSGYPLPELHEQIRAAVARRADDGLRIVYCVQECVERETVRALADDVGFSRSATHRWSKKIPRKP